MNGTSICLAPFVTFLPEKTAFSQESLAKNASANSRKADFRENAQDNQAAKIPKSQFSNKDDKLENVLDNLIVYEGSFSENKSVFQGWIKYPG